jgi:aminopeptidase-like protein
MTLTTPAQAVSAMLSSGEQMLRLMEELYPICRSITGDGVRQTLRRIQQEIPIEIREVPSGTQVFDWTVPKEWNIQDAYIKDALGNRVVDFRASNLHVVNYSVPVHERMSLADLRPHLHSMPDRPDWIPYRTTYYKESWGFCLTHRQLAALPDGEYEVCIDSTLEPGFLTYGELFLAGESEQEILVSCHVCHPSLCNDNLSGIVVAVSLAQQVAARTGHYSYRFLFIPGTIGAVTWLARNEGLATRVRNGLILAGVGDRSPLAYKKSRRGDAEIDRALAHLLSRHGRNGRITEFSPYGYDERQFCSPGFNLPVGRLSRAPHGEFPEYHTSGDNLDFVSSESLAETATICGELFDLLESNDTYQNLSPKCEPQLGKRGLYRAIGGSSDSGHQEMAMLWVLNLSDGTSSLLDIAERSGMDFAVLQQSAVRLAEHGLLRKTKQPRDIQSQPMGRPL